MAGLNKAAVILYVVLLLSLLLVIDIAESRLPKIEVGKGKGGLVCSSVYGAQANDSCFSITQAFNLTSESFAAINPNLVCEKMFVGQWLCVDGTAN